MTAHIKKQKFTTLTVNAGFRVLFIILMEQGGSDNRRDNMRNEYVDVELGPSISEKTVSDIYQYDRGLKLRLSGLKTARIVQIQYAVDGMKETITNVAYMEADKWVSAIPNEALERGRDVHCYVYITDSYSGMTIYHITLAVTKRVKPNGFGNSIDYTCPSLQMYAGDTTTWQIVLFSERNIPFTTEQLDSFNYTLLLVPAGTEDAEPVLTKAGRLITNQGEDATVQFSFAYADTISLEGEYIYQIEMRSEAYCKTQQGNLTILKNYNTGGD